MSLAPANISQLMLCDLPQTDCDRLHVFMRVGSSRLRRHWSIGSGNNTRVVLCGGDAASTIPGSVDVPPRVVRVVDPDARISADGDSLVRPFGFDDVIDILVAAEASMADSAAEEPAKAASAPAAAVVARAAPAAAPAPTPMALARDARVRLKRWPPADVLGQWRNGIRLASFLSARLVSVRELAELSNVAESECTLFVHMLLASDVLRVQQEPAAAKAAPTAAPLHAPAPASLATKTTSPMAGEASAPIGLLGRLRRKLGIALGAA
jgi:hypothetical protein